MNATHIHKFEAAGLGAAPYWYAGCERTVVIHGLGADAVICPAASCDYCSTAISTAFHLVSADGKRFKVGCDCITKAGDAGLKRLISADVRRMEREKRAAREAKRNAAATARAAELLARPEVVAKLAALPHPNQWRADKGETLLDSCKWMLDHAGAAGRANTVKLMELHAAGK